MPYFITKRRFWAISKGRGELFFLEGPRGSSGKYSGMQVYGGDAEVQRLYNADIKKHRAKGFELVDAGKLPARGTKGVRFEHPEHKLVFEIVKLTSTEAMIREGLVGATKEWTQHARDWETLQGRLETHIAHRLDQGYVRVSGKVAPSEKAKPKPKPRRVARPKGIAAAFALAETWLKENGGAAIVKNLAKPATDAALAKAEKQLGFPIPEALTQLWKVHNGQKEEGNPFMHSYNFLSVAESLRFRKDFIDSIQFILDDEDADELKPKERDDHWLPVAMQDSDMLVVHATTGRVFDFCETLDVELAKNFVAWMESYAQSIAGGRVHRRGRLRRRLPDVGLADDVLRDGDSSASSACRFRRTCRLCQQVESIFQI